jgi:hypothetical protein
LKSVQYALRKIVMRKAWFLCLWFPCVRLQQDQVIKAP